MPAVHARRYTLMDVSFNSGMRAIYEKVGTLDLDPSVLDPQLGKIADAGVIVENVGWHCRAAPRTALVDRKGLTRAVPGVWGDVGGVPAMTPVPDRFGFVTPAERLRLIRAAAATLAALPVEEMQLTLNQFGVHTYDFVTSTWGTPPETPLGYSMGRLGDTSDETLQGLHDYLTGVDESSAGTPGHGPWQNGAATVFISHRHEDAAFAAQVAQVLTDWYTVDAFVAHVHISPSLMWRNQIRLGLATCDAFVAILHPEFHTSEWCDQEVGWALGRRIPILPVRRVPASDVRHDGFLGDHQDCVISPTRGDGTHWVAKQTLETLLREPKTRPKGIQAVVNSFARSKSWDHTRWLWSLLGDDPTVTPEQVAQLAAAAETNVDVSQCVIPPGHSLPDLINALAARVTPEPEPETPPF